MRITGVMMQYYISCKRELWLFSHNLNKNYENDDISKGKLIHKKAYLDRPKIIRDICIDNTINIDIIDGKNDLRVYEIKKSTKLTEPAKYQLYYYLWYLKKKGLNARGILKYPKEKKQELLTLSSEKELEIEKIICDVKKIVKSETPPKVIKKPYCKGCSYYEFCWC